MNTDLKLHSKVAVVTGASRGIGRAIAIRLARDGASVGINYKSNEAAARQALSEIEAIGGRAILLRGDVADSDAMRECFARTQSTLGALDILINNAGLATFSSLNDATPDQFDEMFNANVRGLFFATQQAARVMNDDGRIINISSGITRVNAAGGSIYAASKSAVEAFSRCWAAELGPRGITVNTVSPGMTETDLLHAITPPEVLQNMISQTPLGRLGRPADIADVVAFLCSSDARWLTAQNLLANGGV